MKKEQPVKLTARPKGLEIILQNGNTIKTNAGGQIEHDSNPHGPYQGLQIINLNKLAKGGGVEVDNGKSKCFMPSKIASIKPIY